MPGRYDSILSNIYIRPGEVIRRKLDDSGWETIPPIEQRETKSGRIITDGSGLYHVMFVAPFPNTEYTVALSVSDWGSGPGVIAYNSNITANGFDIVTRGVVNGHPVGAVVVSWLATRNFNA